MRHICLDRCHLQICDMVPGAGIKWIFRERLTFFTVVGLSATIQLSVCVLPGTKRQCTVEDTLIITGRGLHATSLSPAVSNV